MKYGEWLNDWQKHYLPPTVKPRTAKRYSEIIRQHILPQLGESEMSEITPLILQRYITELSLHGNLKTGEGLSPNSINSVINVIRVSFRTAAELELIEKNVAEKIKRPKNREKHVTCFTAREQKKIEDAILSQNKPKMFGILLCLYTGLRIGELLALTWADIIRATIQIYLLVKEYTTDTTELPPLSDYYCIPFVEIDMLEIDKELFDRFSFEFMKKNKFIPVKIKDGTLLMAIAKPLDFCAMSAISAIFPGPVDYVLSSSVQIDRYHKIIQEKQNTVNIFRKSNRQNQDIFIGDIQIGNIARKTERQLQAEIFFRIVGAFAERSHLLIEIKSLAIIGELKDDFIIRRHHAQIHLMIFSVRETVFNDVSGKLLDQKSGTKRLLRLDSPLDAKGLDLSRSLHHFIHGFHRHGQALLLRNTEVRRQTR